MMNLPQDRFVKLSRYPKRSSRMNVELAHEIDHVTKEEVRRIKKKAQEKMNKQNR